MSDEDRSEFHIHFHGLIERAIEKGIRHLHLHFHPDAKTAAAPPVGNLLTGGFNQIDTPVDQSGGIRVHDDGAGLGTGFVCCKGEATFGSGPFPPTKVYAKVYDHDPGMPLTPPSDATETTPLSGDSHYRFDAIPSVRHSTGGVRNWIVVWPFFFGVGYREIRCVSFDGVTSTHTECEPGVIAIPPPVLAFVVRPRFREKNDELTRVELRHVPARCSCTEQVWATSAGDPHEDWELWVASRNCGHGATLVVRRTLGRQFEVPLVWRALSWNFAGENELNFESPSVYASKLLTLEATPSALAAGSYRAPPAADGHYGAIVRREINGHAVYSLGRLTSDLELTKLTEVVRKAATASRPLTVVEVGSWVGESAVALASGIGKAGGKVHCVEHFQGNVHDGLASLAAGAGPELLRAWHAFNCGPLLGQRIELIEATSLDAAKRFPAKPGIDVLFVDGEHTEAALLADLQAWLPKVRKGGTVLGHDHSDLFPGVAAALQRIAKKLKVKIKTFPDTTLWYFDKP